MCVCVFSNIIMAKGLKPGLLGAASQHLAVHILVRVSLVSSFMWAVFLSNCAVCLVFWMSSIIRDKEA